MKAYNAFRQTPLDLVEKSEPNDAQADQELSMRDTTLSGLRHAAKLIESTHLQPGGQIEKENFLMSLPQMQMQPGNPLNYVGDDS